MLVSAVTIYLLFISSLWCSVCGQQDSSQKHHRRLGQNRAPPDFRSDLEHCEDPFLNNANNDIRCDEETWRWEFDMFDPNTPPLSCSPNLFATWASFSPFIARENYPDEIEPCVIWFLAFGRNTRQTSAPARPSRPPQSPPTSNPTTSHPSYAPSRSPSLSPSYSPTSSPSVRPSAKPSISPTPNSSEGDDSGTDPFFQNPAPSPDNSPAGDGDEADGNEADGNEADGNEADGNDSPTSPVHPPSVSETTPPATPDSQIPVANPTNAPELPSRDWTALSLTFYVSPQPERVRRKLLSIDRSELHEITSQHLREVLDSDLGRGIVHDVNLVMTSVNIRLLQDGSLKLTEAVTGSVAFTDYEVVVRLTTLNRLVQKAFEGNALDLYLFRLQIAQDTALRRTYQVKLGASVDLDVWNDDEADGDGAEGDNGGSSSPDWRVPLIAIFASMGAAILAICLLGYVVCCANRGSKKKRHSSRSRSRNNSFDDRSDVEQPVVVHTKSAATQQARGRQTFEEASEDGDNNSQCTSTYSYLHDDNSMSQAPSFLYSINEGSDEDEKTPPVNGTSRKNLWNVVGTLNTHFRKPNMDSEFGDAYGTAPKTRPTPPRILGAESESESGASNSLVYEDEKSLTSDLMGGNIQRVLKLDDPVINATPSREKFEDLWEQEDPDKSPKRSTNRRKRVPEGRSKDKEVEDDKSRGSHNSKASTRSKRSERSRASNKSSAARAALNSDLDNKSDLQPVKEDFRAKSCPIVPVMDVDNNENDADNEQSSRCSSVAPRNQPAGETSIHNRLRRAASNPSPRKKVAPVGKENNVSKESPRPLRKKAASLTAWSKPDDLSCASSISSHHSGHSFGRQGDAAAPVKSLLGVSGPKTKVNSLNHVREQQREKNYSVKVEHSTPEGNDSTQEIKDAGRGSALFEDAWAASAVPADAKQHRFSSPLPVGNRLNISDDSDVVAGVLDFPNGATTYNPIDVSEDITYDTDDYNSETPDTSMVDTHQVVGWSKGSVLPPLANKDRGEDDSIDDIWIDREEKKDQRGDSARMKYLQTYRARQVTPDHDVDTSFPSDDEYVLNQLNSLLTTDRHHHGGGGGNNDQSYDQSPGKSFDIPGAEDRLPFEDSMFNDSVLISEDKVVGKLIEQGTLLDPSSMEPSRSVALANSSATSNSKAL